MNTVKDKFISLSNPSKGEFNIQIFTNETVYGQLRITDMMGKDFVQKILIFMAQ